MRYDVSYPGELAHIDLLGPIYLGIAVRKIRTRNIGIIKSIPVDDPKISGIDIDVINPMDIIGWSENRIEIKKKQKSKKKDLERYTKVYVLVIEDDCSRWGTFNAIPSRDADTVTHKCLVVFDEHGYPLFLMGDNAKEFKSATFHETMHSRCVIVIHTVPRRPKTNGKAERLVKTLREYLGGKVFNTIEELQEELEKFFYHYNYERPNQATGNLPPATFLSLVFDGVDPRILRSHSVSKSLFLSRHDEDVVMMA